MKKLKTSSNQASKTYAGFEDQTKAEKLPFYELLYRAYFTGCFKANKIAKRVYYEQCLKDLRDKMIVNYPGKFIIQNLHNIE